MKSLVKLIVLIALIIFGKEGYAIGKKYYDKYNHAKHLKFGIADVSFPKLNLMSLFNEAEAQVYLRIKNFSKSIFNIEQISVEVLNEKGELIAEQQTPLSSTFKIKPNQNSDLPLTFLISSPKLKRLISQAGGTVNVGARYLTTGNYGIPLHLKGFVVADGFEVPFDEKITV